MIRITVGRADLLDRIEACNKTWLQRAAERTAEFGAAGKYVEGSEFWGDIKQVYIDLQHEKCAYCETRLQGDEFASKVHEVEHFRPKKRVRVWPDRKRPYWRHFPDNIVTGAASATGYYLLALHPFNYSIGCTRCNSTLKSDYFPVRGTRAVTLAAPDLDADEDKLLIYPLSDLDIDPAEVITFDGVLAVPRAGLDPRLDERAVTTIAFFQLNHQDLTTRRAEMLVLLWNVLEHRRLETDAAEHARIDAELDTFCGPSGQFSACMAAFRAMHASNHELARKHANNARELLSGRAKL